MPIEYIKNISESLAIISKAQKPFWYDSPAFISILSVLVGFFLSTLVRLFEKKSDQKKLLAQIESSRKTDIKFQFSQLIARLEEQYRKIIVEHVYARSFALEIGWSGIKANLLFHNYKFEALQELENIINDIDSNLKKPGILEDEDLARIKKDLAAAIGICVQNMELHLN